MNILVTAGATREPIDKVRFITNISTGRTGAALADALARLDHKVTFLHGEGSAIPQENTVNLVFKDFADLDMQMRNLLRNQKFNVVVHLAAVSDYSIESIVQEGKEVTDLKQKLSSSSPLELKLKTNHKILNRIKDYSKEHEPMVVGFKLTHSLAPKVHEDAIEKIFEGGSVDLVVHNDLGEIEKGRHDFHLYNIFEKVGTFEDPRSLAYKLHELIGEVL